MQTTATCYSRSIYIEHAADLQAGDLVDISTTFDPRWATVELVGICADDRAGNVDCDGNCRAVIFFVRGEGVPPWHVGDSDEIYARLPADATQDDVDRENGAHCALSSTP
jgi:hypothetical protein